MLDLKLFGPKFGFDGLRNHGFLTKLIQWCRQTFIRHWKNGDNLSEVVKIKKFFNLLKFYSMRFDFFFELDAALRFS
jgi:hypothetical protein